VKAGKKFEFNYESINSTTLAVPLVDDCIYPESVLCRPQCFNHHNRQTVDIQKDILQAKHSKYYASFSKIEDFSVLEEMFKSLGAPAINVKAFEFEHAFIANLEKGMITAQIHANSVTSSMAVQFVGTKWWYFWSPQTTRDHEMMNGFPGTGLILPTQAPNKPYKVHMYHSQPGDVLFFSENWAHAVYTEAGPNVMMNFRHLEFGNFYRQPFDWLHSMSNILIEHPRIGFCY
jgi:hypothetical protein